jgi:hypothetical protein
LKLSLLKLALSVLLIFSANQETTATIMRYPPSIDALAQESDIVVKAKVLSSQAASVGKDFPLANNFWKIYRAKLQIISCLKGAVTSNNCEFFFRSAEAVDKMPGTGIDVGPENYSHYKLEPGQSYIIFIKKHGSKGMLVQSAEGYGLRSWEGFFNAADDKPLASGLSPSQAVWQELTRSLHGKSEEGQREAAMTLLDLSKEEFRSVSGSNDFKRELVLEAIFGSNGEPPAGCLAAGAMKDFINAIGSSSPYTDNSTQMRYMWTKADKPLSRWSEWPTTPAAVKAAVPFLIKVADGNFKPDARAQAIYSLGGRCDVKDASCIKAHLARWLADAQAEVRAAATILSADYGPLPAPQAVHLQADAAASVRAALAYNCGIARSDASIAVLEKLFTDKSEEVRAAAALSLMACPVDKVKAFLAANLDSADFGEGFLARLAAADPITVRDRLLALCKKNEPVQNRLSRMTQAGMIFQNGLGTDLHYLCVSALSDYLDGLSGSELQKTEYGKFLDSLESIAAKDPSQTGRVYQMLKVHHLDERAVRFKKRALAAQPTIPPVAFDQVDMELRNKALQYK